MQVKVFDQVHSRNVPSIHAKRKFVALQSMNCITGKLNQPSPGKKEFRSKSRVLNHKTGVNCYSLLLPSKKRVYRIDLATLGKNVPKGKMPGFFSSREGQDDEDIEFEAEDEPCAGKIQVMITKKHDLTRPNGKMLIENFLKKCTSTGAFERSSESDVLLTEGTTEASKSPVEAEKKEFAHHVPLSSRPGGMDSYLASIKEAPSPVKAEPVVNVVDTYKKNMLEGYLWKRRAGFRGAWKSKYCILKHRMLIYFNCKGSSKVKGCLQFNNTMCQLAYSEGAKQFELKVEGCSKKFEFMHTSATIIKEWVTRLKEEIKQFTATSPPKPQFWKYEGIALNNFERRAETGDILLFTGKRMVDGIQRVVTRSRFDHVAMVVRNTHGNIEMFEALGNSGVTKVSWKAFVDKGTYKQYERIVYRHLKCRRVPETLQRLENYIKKTTGRRYGFSIMNLFRFSKSTTDNSKNYFCSELVADAYISMGILSNKDPANTYLPVSFSGDQQLEWKNGAALGQEYLIKFE